MKKRIKMIVCILLAFAIAAMPMTKAEAAIMATCVDGAAAATTQTIAKKTNLPSLPVDNSDYFTRGYQQAIMLYLKSGGPGNVSQHRFDAAELGFWTFDY